MNFDKINDLNKINEINNNSGQNYPELFAHAKKLIESEDVEAMKSEAPELEKLSSKSESLNPHLKHTLGCYLGVMYHFITRRNESLETLEGNLKKLKEVKASDSDIAYFTMHLGNVYRGFTNLEKSRELLSDSLNMYETHFPNEYPREVGQVLGNLGVTARDKGDIDQAIEFFKKGLQKFNPENEEDPKVGWMSGQLGIVYKNLGDYENAKTQLEKALQIYQKHFETLGKDAEGGRVAWASAWLGNTYTQLGMYEEANSALVKSIELHERFYEKKNTGTAQALFFKGMNHNKMGDFAQAKIDLEESLEMHKFNLIPNTSPKLGRVLLQLGTTYANLGDFTRAKELFNESLISYEKSYDSKHIEMGSLKKEMGLALLKEGNLDSAEKYLNESLKIFQENNHPESNSVLKGLEELDEKKSKLN